MKVDLTALVLTAVLVLPAAYLLSGPVNADEIKPGFMPDTAITSQVRKALKMDPALQTVKLSVKTFHGAVRIAGLVETDQQLAHAEDVVSRVHGVQEVHSHLSVKDDDDNDAVSIDHRALARL